MSTTHHRSAAASGAPSQRHRRAARPHHHQRRARALSDLPAAQSRPAAAFSCTAARSPGMRRNAAAAAVAGSVDPAGFILFDDSSLLIFYCQV